MRYPMTLAVVFLVIVSLATTLAEDCVDDDARLAELAGNTVTTCARIARNNGCTQNCAALTQVCCKSCTPLCSGGGAIEKKTQMSRYCEILVSRPDTVTGEVFSDVWWNGGCDATQWDSIRHASPAEREALVRTQVPDMVSMKLNGPRYMLIYQGSGCCGAPAQTNLADARQMTVAGLQFYAMATLPAQVGASSSSSPYNATQVSRSRSFTWCEGCETYQLTDANSDKYIMQSLSQYVDPLMDVERLRTLGDRLSLPTGWKYDVVTLTSDFTYAAVVADVIVDDFENTYTKMHRAGCEICAPAASAATTVRYRQGRDSLIMISVMVLFATVFL